MRKRRKRYELYSNGKACQYHPSDKMKIQTVRCYNGLAFLRGCCELCGEIINISSFDNLIGNPFGIFEQSDEFKSLEILDHVDMAFR